MPVISDPVIEEYLMKTKQNIEYSQRILKEIDRSLQKSFNPRLAYVSAYSSRVPEKPTEHLDYLGARDIERSVSSLPLLATTTEYKERMNSLTGPLDDSKAECVDDPVAAPVGLPSIIDAGDHPGAVGLSDVRAVEMQSVETMPTPDIQNASKLPTFDTLDSSKLNALDIQGASKLSTLETQVPSRVLPLDPQASQKGSMLDISTQQSHETSILDVPHIIPSRLSIQTSELPEGSHSNGTEDLAGEASIEPVDVSTLVGEYGGNRYATREISMPNEISTIQVDQIEEATILDINEPDDLFVTDRKVEYSYSSDEILDNKQLFVCSYRTVIWD